MKTIKISTDYTRFPGGRLRVDGNNSAEEFRTTKIEPFFENEDKIIIDLDDVEGFSTAFLEETFGGLVRKFGKQQVLDKIEIKCTDEPLLIEEIKQYIDLADEK